MPRGTKTPTARLKLVIRRLPPTLPEETFWRVVEPYVEGKSAWRRYVKGRPGDAYGLHPQHSRAYVLMNDVESLVAFHAGFDGHIFRAKTGAEFQAVVEFAPIEKTPYKSKVKKDAREGTIDEDPDYLSFLENRGAVENKPPLEIAPPPSQPTSTPLLDALRASASKSRAKAAKKKEKAATKKDEKDSKADAKSDKARAAALASISEAANKRAPKTGGVGGVVMVAGKGREVFVAPADAVQDGDSRDSKKSDKEKKKRKPRKKKEGGEEGGEAASIASTGAPGAAGAAPKEPRKDARAEGGVAVVDEASTDSKRRNRNRKRGGGAGGGGEGRPTPAEGGVVEETSGTSRRQKARAAREPGAAATGGASGSGSAPRGRGRGGLLPTEARIDM